MKKIIILILIVISYSLTADAPEVFTFQAGKSWNKYDKGLLEYTNIIEETSIYFDFTIYFPINDYFSLGLTFNESKERFYKDIKTYEHVDAYMYGFSTLYFPISSIGLFLRGDAGFTKMEKTLTTTQFSDGGRNLNYKSDNWGFGYSGGIGYVKDYFIGTVMFSHKNLYDNEKSKAYSVSTVFFILGINIFGSI